MIRVTKGKYGKIIEKARTYSLQCLCTSVMPVAMHAANISVAADKVKLIGS